MNCRARQARAPIADEFIGAPRPRP